MKAQKSIVKARTQCPALFQYVFFPYPLISFYSLLLICFNEFIADNSLRHICRMRVAKIITLQALQRPMQRTVAREVMHPLAPKIPPISPPRSLHPKRRPSMFLPPSRRNVSLLQPRYWFSLFLFSSFNKIIIHIPALLPHPLSKLYLYATF